MGDIVKTVCPISWEAFEDYILHAEKFSSMELRVLKASLAGFAPDKEALVASGLSTLEAAEFIDKLTRIQKL